MSQEKAYKVEVRGARGLLPMDPNGQSDPYCLVGVADTQTNTFLDPSNVVRSKTHFVTLNPVWKNHSMITKSAEYKIRVEVWDKDQAESDDFEGMAIFDLSCIEDDITDRWIPLVGRTQDERVTGEVNIVVTRGTIQELQRTRSNSVSNSQEIPNTQQKEEDQRTIKRLTADLKTKSGRLERMEKDYSMLDQQCVRSAQEVEQLKADKAQISTLLSSKEDALAKANAYALELQLALQERQNVNKLVQEWNEKAKILKAKTLQHTKFHPKKAQTATLEITASDGQTTNSEVDGQTTNSQTTVVDGHEMSIEKMTEEWIEYTTLIETLEIEIKDTQKELEESKSEQQLRKEEREQVIEKLRFDLKERSEEVERQREVQLQQVQRVEESMRELEVLRVEIKAKDAQLDSKRDHEQQLDNVTITIERLQGELAEKSIELSMQQTRVEEIKVDLQMVEEVRRMLKEREEEVEQVRKVLKEREEEVERLRFGEVQRMGEVVILQRVIEERINTIQTLEIENLTLSRSTTEAYARLEEELKVTKERLQESEKELQVEKSFHQVDLDVVVARPKQKQQQEEVVHDSGGAQFASHQAPQREVQEEDKEDRGREEEEKEKRHLKEELDELDELEEARGPATYALSSLPLLPHIHMKHSIPKTPEAARAKQKRLCVVCL